MNTGEHGSLLKILARWVKIPMVAAEWTGVLPTEVKHCINRIRRGHVSRVELVERPVGVPIPTLVSGLVHDGGGKRDPYVMAEQ